MTSVTDRSDRPLGGVELLDLASAQQRESEREETNFMGFVMVWPDRGWGGVYEQHRRWAQWRCEECNYLIEGAMSDKWIRERAEKHHTQGHTPCRFCGKKLLNRQDGTPRQHSHNRCSGKSPAFKIEREFVKNMTTREFA